MYTTHSHSKRFPTYCRFFSQGNCRAGQDCHFAHILPLKGSPHHHTVHSILFGDETVCLDLEPESIQKAIRDLELDQLDRAYKDSIIKSSMTDSGTCIRFNLAYDSIELLVPYHYPDLPCSIRIGRDSSIPQHTQQQMYDTFESYQHELNHMTLVQQLNGLCDSFALTSPSSPLLS